MVEKELGQDQMFFDMCKEDLVNHVFISQLYVLIENQPLI